jgi:hypothetical protein
MKLSRFNIDRRQLRYFVVFLIFSFKGGVGGASRLLTLSEVAGGYNTGFARGVEEARTAINQFDKESLKSIDADKPPSCPLADKQDDYCDGWKDGWRQIDYTTLSKVRGQQRTKLNRS